MKRDIHRDMSRLQCHGGVTQERDIGREMGSALNASPSCSGASRAHAFCAGCQVGQGRNCACRSQAKSKRRELTPTEAIWLVLLADVACLLGVVALVRWAL